VKKKTSIIHDIFIFFVPLLYKRPVIAGKRTIITPAVKVKKKAEKKAAEKLFRFSAAEQQGVKKKELFAKTASAFAKSSVFEL
jgi:hypothetical protein